MYIDKIEITNIRAIEHFTMTFKQHAGWHVLIGDNGAGKSSFVKAMAVCLIGDETPAVRENMFEWQRNISVNGEIIADFINPKIVTKIKFLSMGVPAHTGAITSSIAGNPFKQEFSMAFGPFRRFTGGRTEDAGIFKSHPKAAAHLSAFGEDVALTEALTFIRELYIQKIDNKSNGEELAGIERFVNESSLLQSGVKIEKIDSTGIFFRDANGSTVPATQLSDGYRSILSLTFEMFREMIRLFGAEKVFENISQGKMTIDVPGVVLIDEADAHLHPTWQTRIGHWFVEHFPNIQFIVTTHSPLICRACEKGSIWRLAAPGSDEESGEITGTQRDRLIYGNVLEAYGTEAFGENVSQSEAGKGMGERLAYLNMRSFQGLITEAERTELFALKAKLPTAG
jgi:predicted ATPase